MYQKTMRMTYQGTEVAILSFKYITWEQELQIWIIYSTNLECNV